MTSADRWRINRSSRSIRPGITGARLPAAAHPRRVVHASVRVLVARQLSKLSAADRLILGEPGGAISARLESVVNAFRTGGINAQASPHIRREVWTKLWGNMSINPLSALTRCATAKISGERAGARAMRAHDGGNAALRASVSTWQIGDDPAERIAVVQKAGQFQDLDARGP